MKKLSVTVISLILTTASSLSFGATLNSMTKEQIKQSFINKTFVSIATDNLNGRTIENTFSMYLDDKGNMLGKMSLKPKNEPQTDKGIYKILEDGSVLLTWQHWDGAKELCAHFFETQNAYLAVSCDNVFHTVFMKEAIQSGKHLK